MRTPAPASESDLRFGFSISNVSASVSFNLHHNAAEFLFLIAVDELSITAALKVIPAARWLLSCLLLYDIISIATDH